MVIEAVDPLHPEVTATECPRRPTTCGTPAWTATSWPPSTWRPRPSRMEGADGVAALWKLGASWPRRALPRGGPVAVAALPGADHLAVPLRRHLRPPAGASPTAAGRAGSTPTGCRSATGTGTWPASTTAPARSGPSGSTGWSRTVAASAGEPGALPSARCPAGAAAAVGDGGGSRSRPGCWSTPTRRDGRWVRRRDAVEERRPDGSVVLAVPVTNRAAFRSFVLGFLDHAEVLGPPEPAGRAGRVAGGAMPRLICRLSADDRLQRLLAVVPWVAAHDGPRLAEVAARFGCTEDELVDDLQLLFLCGLHPYTPDMLIDVDIADGRVWIRYAEYFARPLRLTPAEGLGLLAAGRTLLAAPGADPTGPLARGLAKLAGALGVGVDEAVEISLGSAPEEVMAALREAVGRLPPGRDRVLRLRPGRVDAAHGRPVRRLLRRRPVVRLGVVPPGRRRAAVPGRPHPNAPRSWRPASRRRPSRPSSPSTGPGPTTPGSPWSWSRRPAGSSTSTRWSGSSRWRATAGGCG